MGGDNTQTVKRQLLIFLAIAATLAGAAVPARAADDRLEKARREIRSRQDTSLVGLLRAADDKRRAIEESIARIERDIADVQKLIDQYQPELERAQIERDFASQAVIAADGAFKNSRSLLGANALSMYATGQLPEMFTLMGTGDISDYVTARVYMDTVVASSSKVVDGFRQSRDRLETEKLRVEEQTKTIVDRSTKLETERDRLVKLAASKQRVAADLDAASLAREEALAAIAADPTGIDSVLKSYGSATEAIRTLVVAAQRGQPVQDPDKAAVWIPVEGRVSSQFGWRTHPIFKYRSFHTGADIAAPYGTKIRAAAPGTVVDVVYLGAYGLVTVVDHGFSLATMYAHQARSLVHPGEHVQAGQIIGAVGCTGWCTGPHVHFEVWSRGNPQNPQRWVS